MKVGRRMQTIRQNRINTEIKAPLVRLNDVNNKQLGLFSLKEALLKADQAGFDLVEISPNADPPVCRIMDYGKFLYEKNKLLKEQKKKQKVIQLKEIKFRPGTDEADYQVKLRNLMRFLDSGDKVKITVRFRGREIVHQKIGINMLNRIKNDLNEFSVVEFFSTKIESRQMIMVLVPKK
ncbi:MAG: translation initiation factor IF-3 [Arsenophonus sp.]|nr:MAG: translation initiation factor IF-3 [Arsenophonus sp.]